MPSGITGPIYEGQDVSLRDYLMRVGRQMSFAIVQKEDDNDAPVRLTTESTYHAERVAEGEAALAELRAMTPAETFAAAQFDYEKRHKAWEKAVAEKIALRARYEDMLAQVEAWEPDPLIAPTKDSAIRFLRESIDFDCGTEGEELRWNPEPQLVSAPVWHAQRIAEEELWLEDAREQVRKDRVRVADRNRLIEAFLRSLPAEKVEV